MKQSVASLGLFERVQLTMVANSSTHFVTWLTFFISVKSSGLKVSAMPYLPDMDRLGTCQLSSCQPISGIREQGSLVALVPRDLFLSSLSFETLMVKQGFLYSKLKQPIFHLGPMQSSNEFI